MKLQTLFILIIISLASGCNQDEAVKHQTQTKHLHKTTPGFVGKPQAPVSFNYEFVNSPAVGEALEILLKFSVKHDSEMLRVDYTTSEFIDSADATQSRIFSKVINGQEASYVIQIVPKRAETSYVNVFVTTLVMGKKQSRAFAIPVSIEQKLPASVILQAKPRNELPDAFQHNQQKNLIIMPATESP